MLHLQEALVGEIWMGHCHLPLQEGFPALGQAGRALPKTVPHLCGRKKAAGLWSLRFEECVRRAVSAMH